MKSLSQYNKAYLDALIALSKGIKTKPRGMDVLEIIPYHLVINNPTDRIVTIEGFETNIEYAEEELKWYYAGNNYISFSPVIEKTWKQFSDDGFTVNSAYGYRIFGNHPSAMLNQWTWVVNKLKKDRDSRQCIININLPVDKIHETKDFPCTVYIQVFIRNNKLIWITNMRSQDIVLGMRNDVYCFTKMQEKMAKELNVELGEYHHICGSLHIYTKHFDKLEKVLKFYETS
jgi:thymidylate synthase